MPIPDQSTVRPILDTIRPQIVSSVLQAWDDWRSSELAALFKYGRSRANYVWEKIIFRAQLAFSSNDDIRILDKNQTTSFVVRNELMFRFKKANSSGHSSNVATQHAMAFHDHQQNLPGLPAAMRVEVVYELNSFQTQVKDVSVVARDNNLIAWKYSLLDAGEVIVPFPGSVPSPQPERPASTIVKIKGHSDIRETRQE